MEQTLTQQIPCQGETRDERNINRTIRAHGVDRSLYEEGRESGVDGPRGVKQAFGGAINSYHPMRAVGQNPKKKITQP